MMHSHTNTSGCLEALINKTTVRSLLRLRPQNVHILLVLLLGLWARVGQAKVCPHGKDDVSDPYCRKCYKAKHDQYLEATGQNLKCSHGNKLATCRQKIDKGPGHMLGAPCHVFYQENMFKHFKIACQKCGLCNPSCENPWHHGSDGNHQYHCKCGGGYGQSQSGRGRSSYGRSSNSKPHCRTCSTYNEFCDRCITLENGGRGPEVTTRSFSPYHRRLARVLQKDYYFDENGNFDANGTYDEEAWRADFEKSRAADDLDHVCTLCGQRGRTRDAKNRLVDDCEHGKNTWVGPKRHNWVRPAHLTQAQRDAIKEMMPKQSWSEWFGKKIGIGGRRLAEDDVTLRRLAEDNVNSLTAFCAWALMLLIIVVVYTLTKMGKRSAMQRRHLTKTQVAF